jgi:pimeloyl-ACP methyl ester carboxylesterase
MLSALIAASGACGEDSAAAPIERKSCPADDGVSIVYSVAGKGDLAIVFIHGGFADRGFWTSQLKAFSDRYRVIALDLVGHGESGTDRRVWGIPEFGCDVRAVVRAEKLKRVVLVGNSLGGPVAIEAALLLPEQVVGVIGVDTFQGIEERIDPAGARAKAEAFRGDFAGSLKQMMGLLFHADADAAIVRDAEARMARTSPAAGVAMLDSLAGYEMAAAVRRLNVPLRAVNGDLYETDVAGVRRFKPDFEAVIMPHMGHYPMLEQPDTFNRLLSEVISAIDKR